MTTATITEKNANEERLMPHRFSVYASEIGLKPGEWPSSLTTTIGNKMPFLLQRKEYRHNALMGASYAQANGCVTLFVWND